MEEEKAIQEKEDVICSVCKTASEENGVVKRNGEIFCKECWNETVRKDRSRYSLYAFFITFVMFQVFFYFPTLVSENRGFPCTNSLVLFGVIGTLCGMIAYEEVYARMSTKITH